MATPTDPSQQFSQDLSTLQSELSSLQTRVQLADPRGAVEDLNTKIDGLSRAVQNLRDRKYVFDKGLADRAANITALWTTSYQTVRTYLDQQAAQLYLALHPIESQVGIVAVQSNNPQYGLSMINSLRAQMQTLDSRAASVETTASGMYDEIKGLFDKLNDHIEKINWTVDRIDEASFQFLPTEAGIMAVKANWNRSGKEDKEDPQGILFLTDHRLIFEQNQEVATKKVFFITTERKKVQQLLLEASVNLVEEIKASKGGFFKNEDYIIARFGHGAQMSAAQFHIFGQDGSEWQSLINKAKTNEFDKDRVIAVDQADVEKVKAAPTVCPACGGVITKPVLRGQDTITCEFCGNMMRL